MSDLLYEQTENWVYHCLNQATQFYELAFPISDVSFDLKGRSAGQVRFPMQHNLLSRKLPHIRFNADLLKQHGEPFIREVVPHECAHVIVFHLHAQRFALKRSRPKPHGHEWQSVMRDVFQLEPRVTHNFAMKSVRTRSFNYHCGCDQKIHQISVIRHNKIRRGTAKYQCRACGDTLVEEGACG